jgi:hypothetical protein
MLVVDTEAACVGCLSLCASLLECADSELTVLEQVGLLFLELRVQIDTLLAQAGNKLLPRRRDTLLRVIAGGDDRTHGCRSFDRWGIVGVGALEPILSISLVLGGDGGTFGESCILVAWIIRRQ